MAYFFLQCVDEACRFRFPAATDEAEAARCPRCRGPLVVVARIEARSQDERPLLGNAPDGGRVLVALLDNIRSIHNVGSMFRTADGAGVAHLHLAGITATPEHHKLAKAALGAHETVGWSYATNAVDMASALRSQGYRIWALEPAMSAGLEAITGGERPERLALVVGNERAGVDPAVLALCDGVLSLPMAGRKSSLNAAVAFGIAVYYLQFGTDDPAVRR